MAKRKPVNPSVQFGLATLDKGRSDLLGRLTVEASEKLGGDTPAFDPGGEPRTWRTARVLDLTLIDQAADQTAPRCINVYFGLEAEAMGLGKRLKIDLSRLLYAVRWLHKGSPPDLDLALAPAFQRLPEVWFDYAAGALRGRLQMADSSLRERLTCSPDVRPPFG